MRLDIEARVLDRNVTECFTMHVGPGTKSFKWLGFSVVQMLKLQAPQGAIHSRGRSRYFATMDSHIIPVNICSKYASFYHPDAQLKCFIKDGEKVIVELREVYELDEYYTPKLTLFSRLAWGMYSDTSEKDELEETAEAIMTADNQKRRNSELQSHRESVAPMLTEMHSILKGQLIDEETTREVALEDWESIKDGGLLKDIIASEQDLLFDAVLSHFTLLSDMYKMYGAVSGGGSSSTIEYVEFAKLMSDMGFNSNSDGFGENTITKIYIETQIPSKDGLHPSGIIEKEISRAEMIICMFRLAIHLYIITPKRKSKLRRQSKEDKSISFLQTPSYAEAFKMFVCDYISPLMNKSSSGKLIKRLLAQEDILLYFFDSRELLMDCFEKFACTDKRDDCSVTDKTMELREFNLLVGSANLFSATDDNGIELSAKDIRHIFASSQHDSAIDQNEKKIVADNDNIDKNVHLNHMVFAEFLEAIVWIAMAKWLDENISPIAKIRKAVEKICSA